jgi:hypothetical protein
VELWKERMSEKKGRKTRNIFFYSLFDLCFAHCWTAKGNWSSDSVKFLCFFCVKFPVFFFLCFGRHRKFIQPLFNHTRLATSFATVSHGGCCGGVRHREMYPLSLREQKNVGPVGEGKDSPLSRSVSPPCS